MIISCTFNKPVKNIEEILGRPYIRIKIKAVNVSGTTSYFTEEFTQKQAFHEKKTESELNDFIAAHAGTTFKNCVVRTESEEITYLGNKKGKVTKLTKKLNSSSAGKNAEKNGNANSKSTALKLIESGTNRKKNYLIKEGTPVPFLVLLGVMTPEGRVISSRYDKFRQINRFLEFIDDILPSVISECNADGTEPLRIADFGCGKSYLTFAVHYFLTEIKKLNVEILGLDLKKDVIDYCNDITKKLGLKGLVFDTGNIAGYSHAHNPDIVITLHACDTATDYALDYAIKHNCKAILSVPCCQHEVNTQLDRKNVPDCFKPLLKYGLIKERFASLVTDSLRAEYLENSGYSVQILEFIDMEHTPKNILIRAVKNSSHGKKQDEADSLTDALKISPMLKNLLK